MTAPILLRYIAIGLCFKIASLVFLEHTEDSSSIVALAYAVVLLCLFMARPSKGKKSLSQ